MAQKSEIKSLVSLLDDPDPYVQGEVKKRLFELGERAVPLLDEQRSAVNNEKERAVINDIIRDITYGSVEEDFIDVLEGGMNNLAQLEKAVLILSRFENPTLRAKEYERKLDTLANIIKDQVRYQPEENKQMRILLNYVFNELGFSGGTTDYYNPRNAYLHSVMERRQGLPISLSLVVLFLARRLDLPFYGVNMPIHFLLRFNGSKEDILIDPFDHGKSVTYNQCYFFLKQNGVDPKPAHFKEATEIDMLSRLIGNLMRSYRRMEEEQKVDDLQELLQILEMMCK